MTFAHVYDELGR